MAFLWEKLLRPLLFRLDAETAHELGMKGLRSGASKWLAPSGEDLGFGEIERFGLRFANPLGIAAGFDKNAVAVAQLASLGFGFVEVGTVTLKPQPGNPKPRVFRLPKDHALINRLGFNNDGATAVAERLSRIERNCVVGVNIGKNKDVPIEEATENYLGAFELLQPFADYIAVNISSPNTPNLRELQRSENLDELLGALQAANKVNENKMAGGREVSAKAGTPNSKPLLVKIAPDLTEPEIEAAVDICLKHGIAGIIATNTTISRDRLKTENVGRFGAGGLSGKPLAARSNEVIRTIFRYSKGKLPTIGVGGIFDADDAFRKISAGASLLQAYTGFVYGGPGFAHDVLSGLAAMLKERGFASLDEAVGSESVGS